jgi:hypothetical protein
MRLKVLFNSHHYNHLYADIQLMFVTVFLQMIFNYSFFLHTFVIISNVFIVPFYIGSHICDSISEVLMGFDAV